MTELEVNEWGFFKPSLRCSWMVGYMFKRGADDWGFGHAGFQTDRPICLEDMDTVLSTVAEEAQCERGNLVILSLTRLADAGKWNA
jgi:hypothetical protein